MSSQKVGSIKIPPIRQRKLQPMEKEDDLVHKSCKPTIHGYFGEWSICSSETDS